MASRFVISNPALAPLFFAVGAGVVGSFYFAGRVLQKDTAVVINRKNNEPWNSVRQDQNTKLYSPNTSFWASRTGLPDPRAAFLAAEGQVLDTASKAKAKVRELKEKASGQH